MLQVFSTVRGTCSVLTSSVHYTLAFLHFYICIVQYNSACLTCKSALEIESLFIIASTDFSCTYCHRLLLSVLLSVCSCRQADTWAAAASTTVSSTCSCLLPSSGGNTGVISLPTKRASEDEETVEGRPATLWTPWYPVWPSWRRSATPWGERTTCSSPRTRRWPAVSDNLRVSRWTTLNR